MNIQLPDHRVGMKRDYEWLPVRPIACPSCGASTPFPPYGLPVCPDCKHEIGPDKANLHSLCYSPLFFLRQFWHESGNDRHHELSWFEEDMYLFAEGSTLRKTPEDRLKYRKRCLLGFRGMGKTYLVTGTLPQYRWFQELYLRHVVTRQVSIVSKKDDEAEKTAGLIRRSLESVWFLRPLIPRRTKVGSRTEGKDGVNCFDVTGKPANQRAHSLQVLSIISGISGNRAHTNIKDDIEQESNTITKEARERLRRQNEETVRFLYSDATEEAAKLPAPTEDILIGTPKHLETLYQDVAREEYGYEVRAYPILYPKPGERVICPAPAITKRLADGLATPGEPTCPKRFPSEEVKKYRMNPMLFLREYMLCADLGAQRLYPLRLQDLIVVDSVHRDKCPASFMYSQRDGNGSTRLEDQVTVGFDQDGLFRPAHTAKEVIPYTITHAAIDPAGGGHDKTGIVVGGYAAGYIHVKCAAGLKGDAAEEGETSLLDRLASLLRAHGAQRVYVERNYAAGLIGRLLRPRIAKLAVEPGQHPQYPNGWNCAIVDDPKTTQAFAQKEERIIGIMQHVLAQHRMVIGLPTIAYDPTRAIEEQLQYQLTHITYERECLKEDGILDALALLVFSFRDMMDVDPEKAAASAIGRQLASLKKPWMPEHVRTAMENRLYRQRMTDHSPNWTGIRRPGDP